MENDNRKVKKPITEKHIFVALGVAFVFFALIGMINVGYIAKGLTFVASYLFGIMYFIFFAYILFVGIFFVIRKRSLHFKFDLSVFGFTLLLLGCLIASSAIVAGPTMNLSNFYSDFFQKGLDNISKYPVIFENTYLGGGIVGYLLAACFNTIFTYYGTMAVYIVFGATGLILMFYKPITQFIKYVASNIRKTHSEKKKEKNEIAMESKREKEVVSDVTTPVTPIFSKEVVDRVYEPKQGLPSNNDNLVRPSFPFAGLAPQVPNNVDPSVAVPLNTNESFFGNKNVEEPREVEQPSSSIQPSFMGAGSATSVSPEPKEVVPEVKINEEVVTAKPQYIAPQPINEEKKEPKVSQPAKKIHAAYAFPSLDLLEDYSINEEDTTNIDTCEERVKLINQTFADLGVGADAVSYKIGPSITRYDLKTHTNYSVSAISKYIDDISIRLGGIPCRFEAVVRGKTTSGLEIPNVKSTTVGFKNCMAHLPPASQSPHEICFGEDISGNFIHAKLDDFPHLLVAGTTGSGKSIFMHSLIMTLIMRNKPEDLKLMLIDPKRVEMGKYKELPHLLCPIITEYDKAKVAMDKLCGEQERRYNLFEDSGTSNIKQYNEYCDEEGLEKIPYIVVVVDEYADLVEGAKDIATPVVKIAQKARAAGIHLVISTQRPSVNVITGVIKANLPTRVALSVASPTDSVTILGEGGAESLLGFGDMLINCSLISRQGVTRVQGSFVSNKEIKKVVDFIKLQSPPDYNPEFIDLVDRSAMGPTLDGPILSNGPLSSGSNGGKGDDQYEMVKEFVMSKEYASISLIQRTFSFGFPRAGKIFKMLQENGVVSTVADNASSAKGMPVLMKASQNSIPPGSSEVTTFVPNSSTGEEENIDLPQSNDEKPE